MLKTLKNLLVVVNDFPNQDNSYITSIFVKEQIKALSSYFQNIFVIVPYPAGLEYRRRAHYGNYVFNNVHVYFLRYLNPLFPITWKYRRDIWMRQEAQAIMKLIEKENMAFDLINAHYTWPSGAVAVELKRRYNVPLVITEHASTTLYPLIQRRDKILVNTWNATDAIIRVNRKDIPLFSTITPESRIFFIPNGYNSAEIGYLPKEIARAKLGLPLDKRILFNLGHLRSYKGQRYLIQAVNELVRVRKDILCLIGGPGPLKRELNKQIKRLHLEKYVKLLGEIPHDQVTYWYNACDIFVLPSLSESFGIVQLEAMACGKPVVATYTGASEEVITSEEYGLLCQSANPEELAEKILLALDKKWDSEKIIKYANQFTWENNAEETLQVYEAVLRNYQDASNVLNAVETGPTYPAHGKAKTTRGEG
jgi:glycosyltransferase involved in cell wall biosynthesis